MRKKLFITVWLLIPVALLAYHYGPGQRSLARAQAAEKIKAAETAERNEDWTLAVAAYKEALSLLPKEDTSTRYKLQLAKANARIYIGELPEAMMDMEGLLGDMLKAKADAKQLREVRASLGTAQYYLAWLMRLEGAATDEWTAEVEQSRQHFRLLAEECGSAKDHDGAIRHQKNLEAVIRLARMDISELQALPLPKQCQGCKNASQKCRSQRESQCKKPPEKPEDARGAGSPPRPDGTGS